ncbi:MAG: hypothetical protein ABSG25_03670 [Bryobacteraceae bacterium]
MILPQTLTSVVMLALLSLVCWSLWASTYKMGGKWRFELYYWDFALGALVVPVVAALTFGSLGFDGFLFSDDLMRAGKHKLLYALLAGVIFNLGNLLLMAGISVAGMSLAFPIAVSTAVIAATGWSYALGRPQNPALLFAGLCILVVSTITASLAYRSARIDRATQLIKAGKSKGTVPKSDWKGVLLALGGGVFLGSFYPLVASCRLGDDGVGPYSIAVLFSAGLFFSSVFFNLFLMNLPVEGKPLEVLDYFKSPLRQHWFGLAGGALWAAGTVASLVASATESVRVSDALISGMIPAAALASSLLGLFAWREFEGLPARTLAKLAVAAFGCGAALIWAGPLLLK